MGYTLERNIVNRGVLILTEQQRKVTGFSLWGQIERVDTNASYNYKYAFPQTFAGYVQAIARGHVLWSRAISYDNSLLWEFRNEFQENLLNQVCLFDRTMRNILDIKNKLGIPYTESDEFIATVDLQLLQVEAFAFKLFGRTTLAITAYGQEPPNPCELVVHWNEPALPDKEPDSSPLVPRSPDPVPQNPLDPDGYDLPSPPYDDDTNDSGYSYDPPRSATNWVVRAQAIFCPNDPGNPTPGQCAKYQENGEVVTFSIPLTNATDLFTVSSSHGGCPSCAASILKYTSTVDGSLKTLTSPDGNPSWFWPGSVTWEQE